MITFATPKEAAQFAKDESMKFHERLQKLERKLGKTPPEMAAQFHVTRDAWQKWKSGRQVPSPMAYAVLTAALKREKV